MLISKYSSLNTQTHSLSIVEYSSSLVLHLWTRISVLTKLYMFFLCNTSFSRALALYLWTRISVLTKLYMFFLCNTSFSRAKDSFINYATRDMGGRGGGVNFGKVGVALAWRWEGEVNRPWTIEPQCTASPTVQHNTPGARNSVLTYLRSYR